MLFGKKEEKTEIKQQPAKPRVEPYEIHVMPPKFHKFLSVKKKGSGVLILTIVIIVIVLGGGALAAYYFMNQMQNVSPAPIANLNQLVPTNLNQNANQANANANTNVNTNENINTNANANVNENVNANENVNTNINLNQNQNINTNTNLNEAPTVPVITYASSSDKDKDGLTDMEEALYGTEVNKPDTDADGFLDGQELINGYNPKAAGSSLLETSGLVNKYENPIFNYEILYPASWLARSTDQSLNEVIFQSNTNEYIQILVEDNPGQLGLVDWYLSQSPLTNINLLTQETTGKGYEALLSPDKLTYYLKAAASPDKIYLITYNIGDKTIVNFLTTFKMMVNSFSLTSGQPAGTETGAGT